jgi:transposase InsO family protein
VSQLNRWALENHPEDGNAAGCSEGETIEESVVNRPGLSGDSTLEWVSWFNHTRLHSSLGDIPPVEYEEVHYAQPALTGS